MSRAVSSSNGGWDVLQLGELAEVGSSKRIFYGEYVNYGVPFYRSKEIIEKSKGNPVSTSLFISEQRFSELKERFGAPSAGDILITSVGTLGVSYLVSEDDRFYFKDGNLTWIKKIKPILDSKFLRYWIESPSGQNAIEGIAIGSTQPAITIQGLKTLSIPLPPLAEQRAIASVLSSLDDKIDLLHRQNKTLEAMAETLFRQWFVEEASEDWEDGVISDLIEFNPKRSLSKGTVAPYLEMAAVSNTTFCPDGWYDRQFSSGTKFINGDTLLARITPCLENGKTAYVTFLEEDRVGWGSTEYIIMRPKRGLHPFFAYVLAKNTEFRDHAEGCLAGSSGRQRVDINHLMNYRMKIPPDKLVQEFNKVMDSTVLKLHVNAVQIKTTAKLRDVLLPKLMSGEIAIG